MTVNPLDMAVNAAFIEAELALENGLYVTACYRFRAIALEAITQDPLPIIDKGEGVRVYDVT